MTCNNNNLFQTMAGMLARGQNPVDHQDEIWSRYGETVATLVMDSSGFSRVSQSHGIVHFLAVLMRLREITQPLFEAHGGRRVKFHADNAFACFTTVDEAIRASLTLHQTIREASLMLTEEEPFQVCIGIGYGHMLYSETLEGYFADEMNLASKLGEDTAAGGETLLTCNAFENASEAMRAGFAPADCEVSGLNLDYYRHSAG